MTKIYINTDYLVQTIKPDILSALETIDNAKNSASYSIPDGFEYKAELDQTYDKINSIGHRVNSIERWIDSIIKSYNLAINNFQNNLAKIDNIEIKPRQGINLFKKM